jgi:hypothetical protein
VPLFLPEHITNLNNLFMLTSDNSLFRKYTQDGQKPFLEAERFTDISGTYGNKAAEKLHKHYAALLAFLINCDQEDKLAEGIAFVKRLQKCTTLEECKEILNIDDILTKEVLYLRQLIYPIIRTKLKEYDGTFTTSDALGADITNVFNEAYLSAAKYTDFVLKNLIATTMEQAGLTENQITKADAKLTNHFQEVRRLRRYYEQADPNALHNLNLLTPKGMIISDKINKYINKIGASYGVGIIRQMTALMFEIINGSMPNIFNKWSQRLSIFLCLGIALCWQPLRNFFVSFIIACASTLKAVCTGSRIPIIKEITFSISAFMVVFCIPTWYTNLTAISLPFFLICAAENVLLNICGIMADVGRKILGTTISSNPQAQRMYELRQQAWELLGIFHGWSIDNELKIAQDLLENDPPPLVVDPTAVVGGPNIAALREAYWQRAGMV